MDIFIFTLCVYLFRTSIITGIQWTGAMADSKDVIKKYIMYFLMFMFAVLLYLKINEESIVWVAGVIILSVCLFISYRINNSTQLLFTVLLTFLSHNLSVKKILKAYFWINLSFFLLTLVLCALGVAEDRIIEFKYGTAHSLGAGHPNTLAALIISILVSWQYSYNSAELNKKMLLIFFVSAAFNWFVLRSRTGMILSIIYPVLLAVIYFLRIIKSKLILNVLKFSVLIIFLGAYMLMTNESLRSLFSDSGFLYRFNAPYQAFQTYGVRPFGSDFEFLMSYFGDSAYTYLLISCGSVPTIIMLGLIVWICARIRNLKMDRIFAAVAIFILQGLMEQYMFRIAYNPTFLFAFTIIDIYQSDEIAENQTNEMRERYNKETVLL